MSSCAGNEIYVEIFLSTWSEVECSKRFKWKLATIGNVRIENCLVDSSYVLHEEHFILALDPKCSGRVNRSKQSIRLGVDDWFTPPKSNEISQNGSMVVETPLQDWHTTSLCKQPVKIWSMMHVHWLDNDFVSLWLLVVVLLDFWLLLLELSLLLFRLELVFCFLLSFPKALA